MNYLKLFLLSLILFHSIHTIVFGSVREEADFQEKVLNFRNPSPLSSNEAKFKVTFQNGSPSFLMRVIEFNYKYTEIIHALIDHIEFKIRIMNSKDEIIDEKEQITDIAVVFNSTGESVNCSLPEIKTPDTTFILIDVTFIGEIEYLDIFYPLVPFTYSERAEGYIEEILIEYTTSIAGWEFLTPDQFLLGGMFLLLIVYVYSRKN